VTADPPSDHLDEHAFIDLNQQFSKIRFPISVLRSESGARRSGFGWACAATPTPAAECRRPTPGAKPSGLLARLDPTLQGQLFTAGAPMLEGAQWNDHGIDFGPLEAKINETTDHSRREPLFYNP
jgi:hypothetical protein